MQADLSVFGASLMTFDVSIAQGVYFLLKGGRIVYVGSSTDITGRIYHHRRDKEFDSAQYLPVEDRENLLPVEAAAICLWNPSKNAIIPGDVVDGKSGPLLRYKGVYCTPSEVLLEEYGVDLSGCETSERIMSLTTKRRSKGKRCSQKGVASRMRRKHVRIKSLNCRFEVNEMLDKGFHATEVATYIQNKGEYNDVEWRSLVEALKRYRAHRRAEVRKLNKISMSGVI